MYRPDYPVLASTLKSYNNVFALFALFPTNGSHVRTPQGERFAKVTDKERRIQYLLQTDYGDHLGFITDRLIVDRFVEYMDRYYGKKITNCSCLAHFLTTGTFIECSAELRYLVLEQGMRVYSGQHIEVGDMVCILYANERLLKSRKNPVRADYMKARKKRRADECFDHGLNLKQNAYTAAQIRRLQKYMYVDDYHFLVCVAKYNGEPVWLSQRGWHHPGDAETLLVLTIGNRDGYGEDVSLFTFIKKRR